MSRFFASLSIFLIYALPCFSIQTRAYLDQKISANSSVGANVTFDYLRAIDIRGLSAISEDSVRRRLTVFNGDRLTPFVINRNINQVREMGVFQDVSSEVVSYDGGKKWIVTVTENPVIGAIEFEGNETLSDDRLLEAMQLTVGDITNVKTVRRDIHSLESAYTDSGAILSKIVKVDMPTSQSNVLRFFIEESTYNDIMVSGNSKTKNYVILREIDIESGDKLNQIELKKNLQRIFNLNYFSEVIPDIQPITSSKNTYDLTINVKEKSTDSLNIGGGWGERSGGFLYNDININNLMGTGQHVSLRGQWGGQNQTYQFKYHNPWMFNDRKSLTFRAWNSRGNFGYNNMYSSGYRPEVRYGVDASLGLPHSYAVRSSHKVRLEMVSIDNTDDDEQDSYSIQSYEYTLSYDTRDIRFNPLNGAYHTISIENGFKFQPESMLFSKYDVMISNFFQTFNKQTIATRLLVGRVNGDVVSTEYYFVGGPNTVRGYDEYPNSFGIGRTQLVSNVEYRFLLSDIFQLLVFIDYGWASSVGSNPLSGKVGKGLGLRINSPLGPIRIDFGIDELGDMRTHFNIGNVF